ncbi:alpha/beta hydrolase [Stenotrophomonas rhizophila]|uniref:alpha/beta hydrolase family protein n=1 Tax=Stenotrophomonas rhizophila TaxID=216778 RepID=UPI002A6A08C9|nr:alpha/beta hydrolase [Stenotrophomonas rhizophila]MDY0956394.1 alpha/beta hydrolase [Stenotrophomonas rhizophila]
MRRSILLPLVIALATPLPGWATAIPGDAPPPTQSGQLQGAPWRIDLPARWNGELVMLAHGFEPAGTPRDAVWPANDATPALLKAGYAVAQSGYASQGWAVSDAIADTERLRQHFLDAHPRTQRSWILGFSMGGAVAIATLERYPQHYAGGVSLCGANLPGEVLAREMLTTLLAFDTLFPAAPGLPVDGLASTAAATLPQQALYPAIDAAVQSQPALAATLATRLQVPANQLAGTISLHALVWHDLVRRSGGVPVGNHDTVYAGFGDDAAFNAAVRRVDADPAAQANLRRQLGLNGALQRPLVIQYSRDDPTISARFEEVYTALAAHAGALRPPTLLPRTGEGHCGFVDTDVVGALQAAGR